MTDSAAFTVDSLDIQPLRDAVLHISKIGYCEALICKRLGLSDFSELLWRALPIYRSKQLAQRDLLAIAIDLFLLQGLISADELNRLFDSDTQKLFVRVGLLSLDDKGRVRAQASLFPVGDRLIFSDLAWPMLSQPEYTTIPADQVMFIGNDSRWLARATVRRPCAAALDLCTGSGIHALLAASHSQRVVAVDINPRAVKCTSFNSQASGFSNVKALLGDLYEPVGEDCFDLITANPPFVPSPVNSLLFRDGGQSGEEVQRRIIAGLPRHLAKGGIAQIVTEFGEREGEPLSERLREWLGGAPMDIYVLRLREYSRTEYAIGHANGDETYDTFLGSVQDWVDNLEAQKYTSLVSVLLAFQWSDPDSSPLTIVEKADPPQRDAGDEIAAAFLTERLFNNPCFREKLIQSKLHLAGPIGIMESWVLGRDLNANTQVKLLGKALPIMHSLDSLERAILVMVKESPSVQELLESARGLNIEEETVLTAIGSVFRRGLVYLTPVQSDS